MQTSSQLFFDVTDPLFYKHDTVPGTSILRKAKGLAKYIRCNGVSLYRGSFPHILLLLG